MSQVLDNPEVAQEVAAEESDVVEVGKKQFEKFERQAKLVRRIKNQSRKCDELCAQFQAKKEEASAKKKEYDSAVATLRRIISTGPDQLVLPGVDEEPETADAPAEATSAQPTDPADDSWRPVSLATLGIADKLLEKLAENDPPLKTVGDVADWTKEKRLTDVKGVGPAKAEMIEAAMEQFWARRKEELADQETEETEGTADAASTERPSRIRLIQNLTGFDNPEHGCVAGSEWDVFQWSEEGNPIVKSFSGLDVLVKEGEFVAG